MGDGLIPNGLLLSLIWHLGDAWFRTICLWS